MTFVFFSLDRAPAPWDLSGKQTSFCKTCQSTTKQVFIKSFPCVTKSMKSFATVQPLLQDFDRCKVKLQVMKLIYGK